MKSLGFILLFLSTFLRIPAQECPPEWVKYTLGGYIYDIQCDHNNKNISETDFKNYLLNTARANLAKQIKVSVHDSAEVNKSAVDGKSSISYSSNTKFSTDINMKLVETKTLYNPVSQEGYAIAYIDCESARNYYINELTLAYNNINTAITLANNHISSGFKSKARSELDSSLKTLESVDEYLFWLNIFGTSQSELSHWQQCFNAAEKNVKQKLAELRHATRIYLICNADIFGKAYPTLQYELKGALASENCSFTNKPATADWIIKISCAAEEYNKVNIGDVTSYISYVKAHITIDKAATKQRIYEDEIIIKGGHNFNYQEAAKKAYKEISQPLESNIKKHISE